MIIIVDVKLSRVANILEFFEKTKVNTEYLMKFWKWTVLDDVGDYKNAKWIPTLTPTFAKQCLTAVWSPLDAKFGYLTFLCFEVLPKDDATLVAVAQNAADAFNKRNPYAHGSAIDSSLNQWLKYAEGKAIPGYHRFAYHLSVALTG